MWKNRGAEMKEIPSIESYVRGAVSIERVETGIRPWRLPFREKQLYFPVLVERAACQSGVRISFESDTVRASIGAAPRPDKDLKFDAVVAGDIVETAVLPAGSDTVEFERLPRGRKQVEIYLPQSDPIELRSLRIDEGAFIEPVRSQRPRWIAYGSSITECGAAESPASTWPAIVARQRNWDLTCLGYAGQCHLDPMIARVIRDLPAEVISLCLGINVQGHGSLNLRTFRAAAVGMVSIIREKHPDTPMLIMSPIYSPDRESTPNAAGMTLEIMREELLEAVRLMRDMGDRNLHYIDGLQVMGPEFLSYLPDRLHPDAQGYKIMGERVLEQFESVFQRS